MKGKIIVIEGTDCSGKETQSKKLEEYLKHIADKSIAIKLQAKLLSHKNIEDRIMYYLSTKADDNNTIYIKSVTDLSKVLSLPRPSVSRSLSNLEDKGLINRNGKYIFI